MRSARAGLTFIGILKGSVPFADDLAEHAVIRINFLGVPSALAG